MAKASLVMPRAASREAVATPFEQKRVDQKRVEQKLRSLPASPGCYIFRDRGGTALYVGKAKSLRSRVKSYFQGASSDERAFIPFLRNQIADFDTVVVRTEKEAAILEQHLVRENKPRFNVKLKDDKEYLNLRLATDVPWPRLELVRRPSPDGARYFGPYHSATAARRTLHLIEKHFQLRTCSDRELLSRKRPCLQYQIQRCPAPCVYEVDRAAYAAQVSAVALFLDGRYAELASELEARMREASAEMRFEAAARCRDQLSALKSVQEQQRVVSASGRDQDVVGLYRQGDLVEIAVLCVRQGRIVDVYSLSRKRIELPDDELVATFLREHYATEAGTLVPDEILVPTLPDGHVGVAEWLGEQRRAASGGRVKLLSPRRGARAALLALAVDNARHAFSEKERTAEDMDQRLARLQTKLRLPTLPRRIECCDISHLGGTDTIGAVVAFSDGVPDKGRYRSYRVKTASPGDDYGAMYEVLARRFRRGRNAENTPEDATPADDASHDGATESRWDLPDLFVVDGGRGQLGVALGAAHDLGLHALPIVGLAKERETASGETLVDRVYVPGQRNPVALRRESPELFLLAHARDEAHRFANRGRKRSDRARRFRSELDDIPGIGKKTKQALLRELGSLARVREASDAELLAVAGVGPKQLERLRHWQSSRPAGGPESTGRGLGGFAPAAGGATGLQDGN